MAHVELIQLRRGRTLTSRQSQDELIAFLTLNHGMSPYHACFRFYKIIRAMPPPRLVSSEYSHYAILRQR